MTRQSLLADILKWKQTNKQKPMIMSQAKNISSNEPQSYLHILKNSPIPQNSHNTVW